MTVTLKVNARNDLHLPAEMRRRLNLGQEGLLRAEVRGNALVLIPVDLEPRYSTEDLEGVDRLHAREKKRGWIRLGTPASIERLVK